MKFALCSDLHLEFGSIVFDNFPDADVLVLAGDIFPASELPMIDYITDPYITIFFKEIASKYEHVIWVAGNHEHYHFKYSLTHSYIRAYLKKHQEFSNIHFLENESIIIKGVHFHGCTLWTDMDKGNPIVAHQVVNYMNDYSIIEEFTASRQMAIHAESLKWLESSLVKDKKNVVVTHHQPSSLSVHESYRGKASNFGYYSELSEFILDHPEINFWCAGHMHHRFDYKIGDITRVVCNPRGYKDYEPYLVKTFEIKVFEVQE